MKTYLWFPPRNQSPGRMSPAVVSLIGGTIFGSLLFITGHRFGAVVAWTLCAAVLVATELSPTLKALLTNWIARFAEFVGRFLTVVLLVPIYWIVFPIARLGMAITGQDLLQVRREELPSYWLPCESDRHKVRYVRRMFVPERIRKGGRSIILVATTAVFLLLLGEAVLRAKGFGHPPLYVPDPLVGYYPAPNQSLVRYGGVTVTNRYGMRAPEFPERKPTGALRIMMIGDSTLWGGSYMPQDGIYARLLERRLNTPTGHSGPAEVLNIGCNAWGPFHETGYIERFGTFGADVVVVCMPIVDVYRPLSGLSAGPFWNQASPPRSAWDEFSYHMLWRYMAYRHGKPSEKMIEDQGVRGMQAYIRLAERLRSSGKEVMFAVLPSRACGLNKGSTPDVEAFRAMVAKAGFAFDYPDGLFCGRGKARDLYHDKGHLHWKGHEIYAEHLDKWIRSSSRRAKDWLAAGTTEVR